MLKPATITLLKQLAYTIFFAAIFTASDYVSNHGQVSIAELLSALIIPVSLAAINTIESFYQAKGDLVAMTALDQIKPRIQFLESRLFQLQPPPGVAQSPSIPSSTPLQAASSSPMLMSQLPTQAVKSVAPMSPKFTAPINAGPPTFAPPVPPAPAPDVPFTLSGPDMEARLSSFPFQAQQPGKSA